MRAAKEESSIIYYSSGILVIIDKANCIGHNAILMVLRKKDRLLAKHVSLETFQYITGQHHPKRMRWLYNAGLVYSGDSEMCSFSHYRPMSVIIHCNFTHNQSTVYINRVDLKTKIHTHSDVTHRLFLFQ